MGEFGKFFSVGLIATATHYLVMGFLVEFLQASPVLATSIGYGSGALVSYLLNYKITFQSNRSHIDTIVRFVLGTVLGFVVNAAIVDLGVNGLGMHYAIAQIVSTGNVFFLNYAVSKFWTFKRI